MSASLRTPETVADTGRTLRLADMRRRSSFTVDGDPVGAFTLTKGCLSIRMQGDAKWSPSITIICDKPDLAFDLAAAINAVLDRHAGPQAVA